MTSKADILGRPPIMRPIERTHEDDRRPFHKQSNGGVEVSFVPNTSTTYSGVSEDHHFRKVSLPANPWSKPDV